MILCCGEALIDMLPGVTEAGQTAYVPHTGGAVFNTAIALGRPGVTTGLFTGLSTDLHGRQLDADLRAAGVDSTFATRSNRPTTLAFVTLSDGEASYTFYDENSAGRMVDREDLPDLSAQVTVLFCGGISLVVEPAADAYAALIEREKGCRLIMVDPNIRPGFIQDEARYRARLARVLGACDILKVSDADLVWLTPEPGTMAERVARLSGPAVTIVTKGRSGSTAFLADGSPVSVPARPVTVVDTVGAGDTFNAGLLACLSQSGWLDRQAVTAMRPAEMTRVLTYAHEVAAIAVSRAGANPPWAAELAT